ncbi:MAG: hypothetical protein OK456_08935 [Thaumarchaeota archaeon]|nr:hypothetical protein [Nitrososphaerota archaeon]
MEQTKRGLSKRQRFYFVTVFIVAFTLSIASVTKWNQLYSSDPEIFFVLLSVSLFASVASNLVANELTVSHISKVGFQGEANPFQRAFYRKFGLNSGYAQVLIGISVAYAVFLLFFEYFQLVFLSFAFTLFPLIFSYDAIQDYLVLRAARE